MNIVEVGSSKQIEYVMEQGAMAPLCTMLSSYNINIVIVVLKGLEAMLRLGCGFVSSVLWFLLSYDAISFAGKDDHHQM